MTQQLFDVALDVIDVIADLDSTNIDWHAALLTNHRTSPSAAYSFDQTDTIWDTTNSNNPGYWAMSTASGYTCGGGQAHPQDITTTTVTRSGGTISFDFATTVTWGSVDADSAKPDVVAAVVIAYCDIGAGADYYCFSYHDAASSVAINGSNLVYNFTNDIFATMSTT